MFQVKESTHMKCGEIRTWNCKTACVLRDKIEIPKANIKVYHHVLVNIQSTLHSTKTRFNERL